MKKLNQTSKIIIFIFIFLFHATSFVLADVTVWNYNENINNGGGNIGKHGPFTSIELCQADRDTFKKTSLGIASQPTACTSSTITAYPVPTASITDTPTSVNAQPQTNSNNSTNDSYTFLAPIGSEKSVKTSDIGLYINMIIKTIIGISAALAVIMIILAGIQMMGDESVFNKVEAKSKIGGAILGLVIALGSYALLNTINPDLLGKNGLNFSGASIETENQPLISNDIFNPGTKTTGCSEGIIYAQTPSGSIPVCKSREAKTIAMITKAKEGGINLFGYGYRSTQRQRELRAQNCGGAANVDNIEAKCNPLTAMPGLSRHENGLAVDFQCDGSQIKSKQNKCYIWLKNNGGSYGYVNTLDSEPWHWSNDGR